MKVIVYVMVPVDVSVTSFSLFLSELFPSVVFPSVNGIKKRKTLTYRIRRGTIDL